MGNLLSKFDDYLQYLQDNDQTHTFQDNLQNSITIQNTSITATTVNIGNIIEYQEDKFPVKLPYRFRLSDPVDNFLGRDTELKDLHEAFQSCNFQVVTGLGGIGKTEMVKKYAKDYKECYEIILFVISDNQSILVNCFYEVAEKFKIKTNYYNKNKLLVPICDVIDELYCEFSRYENTLIIFDNVEEQKDIINYQPKDDCKNIKVLITSRKNEWNSDNILLLSVLKRDVAIEYIKSCLKTKNLYIDDDNVIELVDLLQCLPLAMKQAVKFIKAENQKKKVSGAIFRISDYLKMYKRQNLKVLNYREPDDIYTMTVFTTWRVTMDKLVEKSNGKIAERLLNYIAYLFPDNISCWEIFKADKDEVYCDAISLLNEYSMIDVKDQQINIHRLVQEVIKIELKDKEKAENVIGDVIELLNDCVDVESDLVSPHVNAVWEAAVEYPNLFYRLYQNFSESPLILLIKEKNGNLETIKKMTEFEIQHKNYSNLYESFKLSITNSNISIVKYLYESLKECKYIYDISEFLLQSFRRRDSEIIKFILNKISDINMRIKERTPLIWACYLNQLDTLELIIKNKDCDFESKDYLGQTALFHACERGSERLLHLLIDSYNWNYNHQDIMGNTVLMSACKLSTVKIVKMLIDSKRCDLSILNIYGQNALFAACQRNDENVFNLLVEIYDWDFNFRDQFGNTVLLLACKTGSIGIVKYLLNNEKVDLYLQDNFGRNAFYNACISKNEDIARVLVEWCEWDFDIQSQMKTTPVMMACAFNWIDIVRKIIESDKRHLNLQDSHGQTVLFYACYGKNEDIAKLIFDSSQWDLNIQDKDGNTVFMTACASNFVEIVRIFVNTESLKLNLQNNNGQTALFHACRSGSSDVVLYLVENFEWDLNATDINGNTVLMEASASMSLKTVQILLDRKQCNLQLQNDKGQTALFHACKHGRSNIVNLFIEGYDWDYEAKDENGETLLMAACSSGSIETVKLLIETGNLNFQSENSVLFQVCEKRYLEIARLLIHSYEWDFDVQDDDGDTIIMKACKSNLIEIVRLLIKTNSCDIYLKNKKGHNVLFWACIKGNYDIVYFLIKCNEWDFNEQDEDGNTPLMLACKLNVIETIRVLVKVGKPDLNTQNDSGQTALMIACDQGNEDLVLFLIRKCKIDFNRRDSSGNTAIMLACETLAFEIVRTMINTDECDLNLQNVNGTTALHNAVNNFVKLIDYQLLEILVENGADPNIKDNNGVTPLDLCLKLNDEKAYAILNKSYQKRKRSNSASMEDVLKSE